MTPLESTMMNSNGMRWQTAADDLADCAHDLVGRIADRGRHPLNGDEAEARQRLFQTAVLMFHRIGIAVDPEDVRRALDRLDETGT